MRISTNHNIFILMIVLSLMIPIAGTSECKEIKSTQLWIEGQDKCEHGLHLQPNGPIAVMIFCEDAVGTYIGIVYYEHMEAPAPLHFLRKLSEKEKSDFYNTWSLANRLWQDPLWASDVTGYAWAPDGTKLYVSTSDIYGSGALYELDLVRKRYKQVAPVKKEVTISKPGPGYVITRMDKLGKRLFYKAAPWNQKKGKLKIEHVLDIE